MVAIRVRFDGKAIIPEEPVDLPRDRAFIVHVDADETAATSPGGPSLSMSDLAVDTGIHDLSRNVDHYLYGHPKRSDDGR